MCVCVCVFCICKKGDATQNNYIFGIYKDECADTILKNPFFEGAHYLTGPGGMDMLAMNLKVSVRVCVCVKAKQTKHKRFHNILFFFFILLLHAIPFCILFFYFKIRQKLLKQKNIGISKTSIRLECRYKLFHVYLGTQKFKLSTRGILYPIARWNTQR